MRGKAKSLMLLAFPFTMLLAFRYAGEGILASARGLPPAICLSLPAMRGKGFEPL